MEKAKARKIKKWDEVHGEYEVEVSEESGSSTPEETAGAGTLEIVPEDKKSVLEKLKEQSRQSTPQLPVPERKPIPGCCFEREIGEC